MNKIKLLIAALVLGGGIYGYYQLPVWMGPETSVLLQVGIVLVAVVVSLAIAASSQTGATFIQFAKGSSIELRKMVWPTGAEARQMTLIVFIAVVLVALFLWAIDALVFNLVYDWLLGVES